MHHGAVTRSAIDVDAAPAEVAAGLGVLEHLVRRPGAAVLAVERRRLAAEVELVAAVEVDGAAPAGPRARHAPRARGPVPRREVAPRPRPVRRRHAGGGRGQDGDDHRRGNHPCGHDNSAKGRNGVTFSLLFVSHGIMRLQFEVL